MLNPYIAFITLLTLLITSPVHAEDSAANQLEEAERLVEIVPKQSIQIAQKFLVTRRLVSSKSNKLQNAAVRNEAERTLRTPASSITALHIIAKARHVLGESDKAMAILDRAEALANQYNHPAQRIATLLLKAHLRWQTTEDQQLVQPIMSQVVSELSQLASPQPNEQSGDSSDKLHYQHLMLKAEISPSIQNTQQADDYFSQAEAYLPQPESPRHLIEHQLTVGDHYLKYQHYNLALYQLLSAYWLAIESDTPILLAKINRSLASVFYQKSVRDKALEHLSQAADFYGNYANTLVLPELLKQMADIYYSQGKYNLALAYYFNVLDSEITHKNIQGMITLRLELAKTYLQLYNFPLTEQYLIKANDLLIDTNFDQLKSNSLLIESRLELQKYNIELALKLANSALEIAQKNSDINAELNSHLLLTNIYQQLKDYPSAYKHGKIYNNLIIEKQNHLLAISAQDFKQQKRFIERSLHYKNQTEALVISRQEVTRYKYVARIILICALLCTAIIVRQTIVLRRKRRQLSNLYQDYYTHPRSGLKNLRLLNVKLPSSLEQSSANFEQWQTGELIDEPLHDKLRFLMIDLPFLRAMYLKQGYKAGLSLERLFGEYIKSRVVSPARLYHFSDAMFLYVEPNTNPDKTAEQLFEQISRWVDEFSPKQNEFTPIEVGDNTIRLGIADYPFLPKAHTAINDKELIDILLMASNIARENSIKQNNSQWVYLKAIENAPAASFAHGDIRNACHEAIENGLIKIHSSDKFEENVKKNSILD